MIGVGVRVRGRVSNQLEMNTVRWGVIGTGAVATQFCRELEKVPGVEISRVCSREKSKARTFGLQFKVSGCYTDLSEFFNHHQLDLVYIASPTNLHEEHAVACLRAGIGVVCEKPLAASVSAADRIFKIARERKLFCLEGMWTRFNPLVQRIKDITQAGDIGEINSMHAEIGYRKDQQGEVDPSRSALWNFGVYAISMFQYLAGSPLAIQAIGTGRRRTVAGLMQWEKCSGTFTISDEVELANELIVVGQEGMLRLPSPCISPVRLEASKPLFRGSRLGGIIGRTIGRNTGLHLLADPMTLHGDRFAGFYQQAHAATSAIRRGEIECPANSWDDTREVLHLTELIEAGLDSGEFSGGSLDR